MPKRSETASPRPAPIQLPLFAEAANLVRVQSDRHAWRFHRLDVWPDLFGCALLLRQWGRIGTEGRRRLDRHPDDGAATIALAQLASAERRAAIRTGLYDQASRKVGGKAVPFPLARLRQSQGDANVRGKSPCYKSRPPAKTPAP
jgi:predicted DNA-binding WGR domain protein